MYFQEIDELSNFDQRMESDNHQYDGDGDDSLDFGDDGISFANEMSTQRVFSYTIANTSTATQKVLLLPSIDPSQPSRVAKNGNIEYVVGATNLACSSSPQSINLFQKHIENNPSRVLGIKVVSSSDAQLATQLVVTTKTPYNEPGNRVISFGNFTSEYASNNKMATVRTEFQCDALTEISVDVPAGATTTFIFFVGAVYSISGALKKKSQRANKNGAVKNHRMQIAGGAPVATLIGN